MQSCKKSLHLAIRIYTDLEIRITPLEMSLFPLLEDKSVKNRLFLQSQVKELRVLRCKLSVCRFAGLCCT